MPPSASDAATAAAAGPMQSSANAIGEPRSSESRAAAGFRLYFGFR